MKKIALLFPGQGSQYVGMGKKLYERYSSIRQLYEEANDILGFNIQTLCFEGSMEELTKTENTQAALLITNVAAFRAYEQEIEVTPEYVAGHSLGEFAALTCAGAIDFGDAVKLVQQRGKLMQNALEGGRGLMCAIGGVNNSVVEEECKTELKPEEIVVVSNYNSPVQTVISGHKAAVNRVSERLERLGAKISILNTGAPFHSPIMQSAAGKFKSELSKCKFKEMNIPVISNVTALPYNSANEVAETLAIHMVRPVKWEATMGFLNNAGVSGVVEIGPKAVLRNLARGNCPDMLAFSYDNEEDVHSLLEYTSSERYRLNQSKKTRLSFITKCISHAVCTRNRNWNDDEYNEGMLKPYKAIKLMHDELESVGNEPTVDQMKQALDMLNSVFKTKRVPADEQAERYNQIFEETGTKGLFEDFKY